MLKFITFSLFFFISELVIAQAKQTDYESKNEALFKSYSPELEGSVTTEKLKYENPNHEPAVLTLLKYDNKDVISGNMCVKEETTKMGFKFVVVCYPKVTFGDKIWVFFYNFGSNVELTFRNGFGWKSRLKDKIIDCRKTSGDFVW